MTAAAAAAFLSLVVAVAMAQPAPSPSGPALTCQLPNTSTIFSNECNAVNQQSMEAQTQECTAFVMTSSTEAAPSAACCQGLNEVAYKSTACICLATFYPPASRNASRQRDLPALCGVRTDLCSKCPAFLVSRSNGTAAPFYGPYKEGKSMASTIGAITLAVVFGLLLLAGIVGLIVTLIKKRRAKNNPPGPFDAAPPGGGF